MYLQSESGSDLSLGSVAELVHLLLQIGGGLGHETRWMLMENTKKALLLTGFCLALLLTGWDSKAWGRKVALLR